MKRFVTVIALMFLAILLFGCKDGLVFKEGPTIQFVIDNSDQLQHCVDETVLNCLSRGWDSVVIFSEDSRLFMCENSVYRDNTRIEFYSSELSNLFSSQKIKSIRVWSSNDSLRNIEFVVGSYGMGSSSLAEIAYIPTDKIEDSLYFSELMVFRAFREGYLGELDGSDNYLFYVRIMPCFYYIEYGD